MRLEEYLPAERLRPFVKSYKIIESPGGTTNTVLPGTSLAMSFRFKGQTSYGETALPFAAFSGLQRSARRISYATNTASVIILFREAGVSAFLKQPLHELYAQSVSLDNFFPATEILNVQERLSESNDNVSRIAIIERFLLSKLIFHHPDKLVSEAISRINAVNGNVKINDLLNDLFISKDAFEKRFRKTAGATPKQFSRIVKMNAVIRQRKTGGSFPEVVFDNGFYDQPHFNKDFKLFTGQTPTDFFKSGVFW